ncbi:hypothetical protein IGI04_034250 [Brassica rapa subsp. trilocularis]|uniref:Uncharacterized protein n=1 Tax=Brassica rapa subsp. trilocularis TaxID=1813537 RepID=A0ABQ7LAY5_BRACM|nr:hypothetical protein IGI04_034250 [Brassica rapa subsp. trilocularis]
MRSNDQSHDPNSNLYQQADSTKWSVHHDAQEKFMKNPKLCLVAKGHNPDHQDPAEIKIALLKIGRSLEMLSTTTTLSQFLSTEHHLVMSNRGYLTYLKHILFKVRIYKLPNIYQRHGIVRSIGSKLDKSRKFLS